jgi:hypothetical protein
MSGATDIHRDTHDELEVSGTFFDALDSLP